MEARFAKEKRNRPLCLSSVSSVVKSKTYLLYRPLHSRRVAPLAMRRRRRRQREQDGFVDGRHEMDREVFAKLVAEILLYVLVVLSRQDHFLDAKPPRGQHLFLDPADR